MYPHHVRNMNKVKDYFLPQQNVEALLFAGSVAHGYALPNSDIDIMIVVSDEEYQKRMAEGRDLHNDKKNTICDYEGGYVDGKYISREFIKEVAKNGSDPARYAFSGCTIAFSRVEGLEELIASTQVYPVELKAQRIKEFYSEMMVWHWYAKEGLRHDNDYLIVTATSKMVLFASRLILAHNEMLYPYHKWMIKELEKAPLKPEGMVELIHRCLKDMTSENMQALVDAVSAYGHWDDGHIAWNGVYIKEPEVPWEDKREDIEYV